MDSKCKRCDYWYQTGLNTGYCNYLTVMGNARSLICPPGDACTVYAPKGKGQRKPPKWVGRGDDAKPSIRKASR